MKPAMQMFVTTLSVWLMTAACTIDPDDSIITDATPTDQGRADADSNGTPDVAEDPDAPAADMGPGDLQDSDAQTGDAGDGGDVSDVTDTDAGDAVSDTPTEDAPDVDGSTDASDGGTDSDPGADG